MKNVLSLLMGAIFLVALTATGSAQPEFPQVDVIVHTAKPYNKVIAAIEDLGGTVTMKYVNVDGLAARIPADALAALSGLKGVDGIEKDMVVNLPKPKDGLPQTVQFDGLEVLDPAAAAELLGTLQSTEPPKKGKGRKKKAEPAGSGPINLDTYYSWLGGVTGAFDTWADTAAGASSIVAIIDTGTWAAHPCLASSPVIAGPDFSTDSGGGFDGSTLSTNHWHGTFVGGVISNDCAIVDAAGGVIATHLPAAAKIDIGGGLVLIPILGMAPASTIYAVKVFPHTGAGTSTSTIIAALDHVIDVKLSGAVDIDVLNMSLGGATLFDGRSLEEQVVDAATDAGILVVISSGNEGPSPGSVARPGTAYTALTVAAGTDHVHTRILWDVVFGAGAGVLMYPLEERGVISFSNRGPSADGRNAVDIIAIGTFNFSGFTPPAGAGVLNWASGTSFSAPTVSGAAALLASWRNINGANVGPREIKNALTAGAVPIASDGWSIREQGHGWVQVRNSLDLLQSGKKNSGERHDLDDPLKPTILLGSETEHTETITLKRGRTFDFLLEITEETETVEINVNTGGPIASGPAPIPNSWEIYVKSAKHGGTVPLVDTANIFDAASIVIGDGSIVLGGAIAGAFLEPAPMEPGIMKVTLEPDWTNNVAELTATVTIKRTNGAPTSNAGGITATFADLDFGFFVVDVPGSATTVTFDLSWKHDWSKVATNDFDLLIFAPSCFSFNCALFDAATLNSPERQVVEDPEAGSWFIIVDAFSVNVGRDPWRLDVTIEED
ncbi:MAG: S8 family serine peptidase [Proteobacteria bacterium]|nr:S8 family serine peptidase [Pseudomonadota bacterium]